MNSVQRTIVMMGLLALCFVSLYAPYRQTFVCDGAALSVPAGRHWTFATPQPADGTGLSVDVGRVLLQSIAIGAFTAGYVVFAGSKKP